MLHTVKRVNGKIMVLNLLLLFFLSLVPFATSWVGETNFAPVPVAVYAIVLFYLRLGLDPPSKHDRKIQRLERRNDSRHAPAKL